MLKFIGFFILLLLPWSAHAGIEQLSENEFRSLANELAPKVTLFQDVWKQDPEAVFYGGTTRDYLYWLKAQFLTTQTPQETQSVVRALRELPVIDIRQFIVGDSDVDVVSGKNLEFKGGTYGVRKIDTISTDIFNPNTDSGKNELWQGFAPAEKIRLGKNGLSQAAELGDGVKEIYTGKLSVHFAEPEKFAQTKYARAGENHPILLALRYLRLQALNYYKTHDQQQPSKETLLQGFDPKSKAEVEKIIASAIHTGELNPFLQSSRFRSWLNGTIQKSFRSYRNPNAALELMKMFQVDLLPNVYGEDLIEPLYQYVFAKFPDPVKVEENLATFRLKKEKIFQNAATHFKDGFFYHGTGNEKAFRSITSQGVLPSSAGSAGKGLYGVPEYQKKFAENWGKSKDRLVKLSVRADAKIIDLTEGEGLTAWERFRKVHGDNYEDFAEMFGADILRYPYGETNAFVVKNSAVLGKAQGVYRELLPFQDFLAKSREMTDVKQLLSVIAVNQFTTREIEIILNANKIPKEQLLLSAEETAPELIFDTLFATDLWQTNPDFLENIIRKRFPFDPDQLYSKVASLFPDGSLYRGVTSEKDFQSIILKREFPMDNTHHGRGFLGVSENGIFSEEQGAYGKERIIKLKVKPNARILDLSSSNPGYKFWQAFSDRYGYGRYAEFAKIFGVDIYKHPYTTPPFLVIDTDVLENAQGLNRQPVTFEALLAKMKELKDADEFLKIVAVNKFSPREIDQAIPHGSLERSVYIDKIENSFFKRFDDISPLIGTRVWNENKTQFVNRLRHELAILSPPPYVSDPVYEKIMRVLVTDGLWEYDPQLLQTILVKGKVQTFLIENLLKSKAILHYPQIIETIIDSYTKYPSLEALAIPLNQENLEDSLRLVQKLLRQNRQRAAEIFQILKSPRWESHPDLLLELATSARKWKNVEIVEKLLALPQWKNHPDFSSLVKNGSISFSDFERFAQSKNREQLVAPARFLSFCVDTFNRF